MQIKILNSKRTTTKIFPIQEQEEGLVNEITIEDDAFHENNSQRKNEINITLQDAENEELNRFKSIWHWDQFIEFLFYHILFYLIIGPFTTPLLYKITGINLMKNLRFWGYYDTFFLQSLLWIGSFLGGLAYFNFMDSVITITELVFMWFVIIVRSVIISAKYATLSPERIYLYKNFELPDSYFQMDLMMKDWKTQGPKILFLEQLRAMQRNEFEESLFKFEFLVKPSELTIKQITDTEIGFYNQWLDQHRKDHLLAANQYDGFQVLGYLIGEFQKNNPPNKQKIYSIIESVLLALSPLFIGLQYLIKNPPTTLDILRIFLNGNTTMSALMGILIFFHIAIYDFQRRFFLIEQCLYLISTKKQQYSSNKLLPTINLNNPKQLQVWSMTRTIILTYGQTYTIRTQGFFSLAFLACIALIFIFLLLILEFITLNLAQTILVSEIAIVFVGFISFYLYYGAAFNGYFQAFTTAIEDLKSLFLDIQRLRLEYFQDNIIPTNFVHKRFVSLMKNDAEMDPDIAKYYTQILVQELDDNLRLIEYDLRNNPFKLYGVVVSFNLLKSAAVGLSTVFSYAAQQKFMMATK